MHRRALCPPRGDARPRELAELVGLSASATSYHLRALERHGARRAQRVLAPTGGSARGGRPPTASTIDSQHAADEQPAAEAVLLNQVLSRLQRGLGARGRGTGRRTEEWRDAATLARTRIWLTADEAARSGGCSRDGARAVPSPRGWRRPSGSREVHAFWSVVPVAPILQSPRTLRGVDGRRRRTDRLGRRPQHVQAAVESHPRKSGRRPRCRSPAGSRRARPTAWSWPTGDERSSRPPAAS